jgi:hypothetical protein
VARVPPPQPITPADVLNAAIEQLEEFVLDVCEHGGGIGDPTVIWANGASEPTHRLGRLATRAPRAREIHERKRRDTTHWEQRRGVLFTTAKARSPRCCGYECRQQHPPREIILIRHLNREHRTCGRSLNLDTPVGMAKPVGGVRVATASWVVKVPLVGPSG